MADKKIICKNCGDEFIFTENEQAFYKEKGFENDPQKCPKCRAEAKKQHSRGNSRGNSGRSDRQMYQATCAECGKTTMVPFKPNGVKPVYCKDCYQPNGR